MYGGGRKSAPTAPSGTPPKDALEALMNGETPDKDALSFPSERQGYPGPQNPSGGRYDSYNSGGYGGGGYSNGGYGSGGHSSGSYNSGYGPGTQYDEYGEPKKNAGALDNVKSGAIKGGTYVKDKTVAGATYLKERDWSKEKEMAGKAGQATKTGAVYVGSNVAKGASWLWKSSKSGVDNLRGKGTGPGPQR